ncbi:serine/threonine-protein kinase [Microbacterium oleivorans]|uniref:serine/threonine-protein kinase n=1 Tax=Microbacterium oleivorans TaxID=273677 RepID=UPI00203B9588|nr:serine/threonine-protein kinase [Microbacterium oleivorans]MCM3695886.1 protein kinase [Microbacterium oleivorans]
MPDTTDATDDLLGGRYRLGETLGRGGMADVFRGEDVVLGREVAIKIVRSGADGVAADSRARGEVSVLAALNHPSLVTLYDAQLDADPPYLVMELVEGPTLTTRIARSPLTPPAAAIMAADLGEALHVAHGAGVVHRDVKPSNVLLAPSHLPDHEFRAKLADFGIAYLVDTARVTNPGEVIGTAAYLAPEQVRGVDPAPPADVYALGLVLIESLTGSRAFPDAAGVATALARLEAPPEIPAGLDPAWQELLRAMTRVDPAERPTALDVAIRARSLATTTSDAPTEALPAGVAAAGAIGAAMADGVVRDDSADTRDGTAADAATEALLPAGTAAGDAAPPPSAPGTAPTSVLAASSGARPADVPTPEADSVPSRTAPAEAEPTARRNRRRPRRRATIWVTAAAAAALVAGAGGILALTAGGDENTPADPPPVTDPTPGVSPTAPVDEEDTAEEVDTVSDSGTTEEQDTTPTPEETSEPPVDEVTPDDATTDPAEDTGTTDGSDEGVTDDDGGGTDPAEPSPAPTDDTVTEPEPADTPTPEAPSPAPTG